MSTLSRWTALGLVLMATGCGAEAAAPDVDVEVVGETDAWGAVLAEGRTAKVGEFDVAHPGAPFHRGVDAIVREAGGALYVELLWSAGRDFPDEHREPRAANLRLGLRVPAETGTYALGGDAWLFGIEHRMFQPDLTAQHSAGVDGAPRARVMVERVGERAFHVALDLQASLHVVSSEDGTVGPLAVEVRDQLELVAVGRAAYAGQCGAAHATYIPLQAVGYRLAFSAWEDIERSCAEGAGEPACRTGLREVACVPWTSCAMCYGDACLSPTTYTDTCRWEESDTSP